MFHLCRYFMLTPAFHRNPPTPHIIPLYLVETFVLLEFMLCKGPTDVEYDCRSKMFLLKQFLDFPSDSVRALSLIHI